MRKGKGPPPDRTMGLTFPEDKPNPFRATVADMMRERLALLTFATEPEASKRLSRWRGFGPIAFDPVK